MQPRALILQSGVPALTCQLGESLFTWRVLCFVLVPAGLPMHPFPRRATRLGPAVGILPEADFRTFLGIDFRP